MLHIINICGTPSSSPVEANHGNKNPILRPKSPGSGLLRHPDEFSDDSLNHSDDEAILTECIQSAMPKVISRFFIIEKRDIKSFRRLPLVCKTLVHRHFAIRHFIVRRFILRDINKNITRQANILNDEMSDDKISRKMKYRTMKCRIVKCRR